MKDWTSGRLADALEGMLYTHPDTVGTTAAMSMLDEASFPFRSQSSEVADAQAAFGAARCKFQRSYSTATGGYSHERWSDAVRVGGRLASALRSLGDDVRVVRCEKPGASRDLCRMPIRPDGTCGYLHAGEEAT
jgi:hypothetical protein